MSSMHCFASTRLLIGHSFQIGHIQFLLRTGIHHVAFRKLLQGLYAYRDYSAEQCDRHIAEKGRVKSDNVFSHLCSANHPDTESALYSLEELRCESSLLILAGSDTTSTCIAATIFYILYNAHVLSRVQKEVRSAFANVEDIRDGPLLNSCVYLRACIDESLRMSPPVGGLMPREVQKGGIAIDGEYFGEGVEVGTPSYAIHHRERYYPDAFTYNPSRWIASENGGKSPEQQAQQLRLAKSAFNAWSVGNRNCVGRSMAYLEVSVVLARLLWSFDMRLSKDNPIGGGGPSLGAMRSRKGEYQLWDAFASNNYGPMAEFRPRSEVST